jgi:hypothetical protein
MPPLQRYKAIYLGGGRHGLYEGCVALAAGRAAADHSVDRIILAPLIKKAPPWGLFLWWNTVFTTVPRKPQPCRNFDGIVTERLQAIQRIN